MNDKGCVKIDYFVHEGEMARADRHIKRLWIALLVVIGMLFASNIVWLYSWMQYDYVDESIDVIAGGDSNANYIGNDGDISNGSTNNSKKAVTDP